MPLLAAVRIILLAALPTTATLAAPTIHEPPHHQPQPHVSKTLPAQP